MNGNLKLKTAFQAFQLIEIKNVFIVFKNDVH